MRSNFLDDGETRVGSLFDGDEASPEVTVTLTRRGRRIELSVPWSDMASPYARWFMPNARYGDDPDKVLYRQYPPPELQFRDQRGTVHLLKCHTEGMTTNLSTGMGLLHG